MSVLGDKRIGDHCFRPLGPRLVASSLSYLAPYILFQGWKYCSAMDMNEFFYSFISKDERERISNIEAFDEFEVSSTNFR